MPTIEHAGFEFDLSYADGEILGATLDSREELLAHANWPWDIYPGMPDLCCAPASELEAWAVKFYARAVRSEIDWPLEPLADQYGCGRRGVAEGA